MIKILSNSTINKIAAGEVIERPASVVKELVENAIDSGASKINIVLERAGKNLITVVDNGFGMKPQDLALCICRHATSKLDEDDLLNIQSFGFRGEALPSIGAISKLTITSKTKDDLVGAQISVIGGAVGDVEPVVAADGTKVEVRDLFFATPARLRFLRSDKTELAACLAIVHKIALSHPDVDFTLTHDGKEILKLRKDSSSDALSQRIGGVVGVDFMANSAEVRLEHNDVTIRGYTSLPTFNKASTEDQYLFINGRPVKDKLLNVAIRVAYQDYLSRDRHPVTTIFLEMSPQLVDVNVHPAKIEVRFSDPNTIRGLLISAIKDAIGRGGQRVSSSISDAMISSFKPATYVNDSFVSRSAVSEKNPSPSNFLSSYAPPSPKQVLEKTNYNISERPSLFTSAPVTKNQEPIVPEVTNFPLGAAVCQVHSTYIISQTPASIIVIDQHAAHERIGYEKIKRYIKNNGLVKQRLLIPEIVEMPDKNRAELLKDHAGELANLGLTIEGFGEKSIIVTEIPSLIGDADCTKLIMDLADHLLDLGEHVALLEVIESVTETYACHYAIRSGKKLATSEMNALLREMEETPFSGQCNHGRPTYVELKLKDIERLFGRS